MYNKYFQRNNKYYMNYKDLNKQTVTTEDSQKKEIDTGKSQIDIQFKPDSNINNQINYQINTEKDELRTFTEKSIMDIGDISFFTVIQMSIQQLRKFQQGLSKHFKKEKILIDIIREFRLSREKAISQEKKLIQKMSIKQQKQLKLWTERIRDGIINDNLKKDQIYFLQEKQKFSAGLRHYFENEIYLLEMIQEQINKRILNYTKNPITVQRNKELSNQERAEKEIYLVVIFPCRTQFLSEQKLTQIESILKTFYSQEVQFIRIIQKIITRNQEKQKKIQTSENILMMHEQLEVWTKRLFLQSIQRPLTLKQKHTQQLHKFKIGVERYFPSETSLLQIVDNLLRRGSKKIQKSYTLEITLKIKDKIFNILKFYDSPSKNNNQLLCPSPQDQFLIKKRQREHMQKKKI